MENTASKHELIKPVILKAGIPLALSLAGVIYAWISTKKRLSSNLSANHANSPETNSHQEHKHEESCHSHSLASIEDEGCSTTSMDASVFCLEQEISGLRSQIEGMKIRELALRFQFDQYCDLKEQQSLLGEMKNMMSLETARVDLLDREISSMETENKRLENFAVQYLRVVEQIEYWKSENRMLRKKLQKLMRKSKALTRLTKEQALKIKEEEAEISRNRDALGTKMNVIDKLEDEMRELQRVLDLLQDEKNELQKKLDIAEKSYHESKTEAGDVSREEYKQLLDELERTKKERTDEANELIHLRWTNACLRHDLMRHQEQQQQNQDRNHIELEFGGSHEVIHYDSEHELRHHSPLEHHSFPSSEEHHRYSACSKRKKLLGRLKRWVEGSEKPRVRHSVSRGVEKHHVPARMSCSSDIV
ncbi:protein CHUP1, chloroplastic-like isoform X2 [Lotus japonicus]|uniref:protein CHUP1, chloroplastic-like isoform X2 n=1 Tax=Lotus japonicus TaxID=34305 RepID=UPI00258B6000|nr:protein CHUP1, chloroplastic-like isoform X2 [Lotus japonicus]